MKENQLVAVAQSMSSLQIAEITGKRHDAILRDIRSLLEQGVAAHNFVETSYTDKSNRQSPCYNLTKTGCLILASGYNAVLREKIINRWIELESGKAEPMVKAQAVTKAQAQTQLTLSDRLAWIKEVKTLLNLNDASTLVMLQKVGEPLGLPLPDYTPSKGVLHSATYLLRANNSPLTINKFNQLMLEQGLLVNVSHPSGYGGFRTFKSIVGDGLNYGENQVCPQYPNGTQPLYYADRFSELLNIISEKGGAA